MFPRKVFLHCAVLSAVCFLFSGSITAADAFASPLFTQRWEQDEQIVPNFWGPLANAFSGQDESYDAGDVCRPPRLCAASLPVMTGHRLVQYFDKGRMELNPAAPGGVTAGLLVREMITGQMQVGDRQFQTPPPAAVPVAGDATNTFPLYRDLASGPAVRTMAPVGAPVTLLLTPQGAGAITPPSDAQTVIALVDTTTGHGLPTAFANFRSRVGLENVGLAITDPFWADVAIGGTVQRILIQAYERRVLTDNSANPAPFQVEFGNVGQHYHAWVEVFGDHTGIVNDDAPPIEDRGRGSHLP
ncbi:MAG: hypothetical protein LC793_11655 [Thermomicrobia bacterium]|nr:hypothetical protein [Thermomicrobia bacterium]